MGMFTVLAGLHSVSDPSILTRSIACKVRSKNDAEQVPGYLNDCLYSILSGYLDQIHYSIPVLLTDMIILQPYHHFVCLNYLTCHVLLIQSD